MFFKIIDHKDPVTTSKINFKKEINQISKTIKYLNEANVLFKAYLELIECWIVDMDAYKGKDVLLTKVSDRFNESKLIIKEIIEVLNIFAEIAKRIKGRDVATITIQELDDWIEKLLQALNNHPNLTKRPEYLKTIKESNLQTKNLLHHQNLIFHLNDIFNGLYSNNFMGISWLMYRAELSLNHYLNEHDVPDPELEIIKLEIGIISNSMLKYEIIYKDLSEKITPIINIIKTNQQSTQ